MMIYAIIFLLGALTPPVFAELDINYFRDYITSLQRQIKQYYEKISSLERQLENQEEQILETTNECTYDFSVRENDSKLIITFPNITE